MNNKIQARTKELNECCNLSLKEAEAQARNEWAVTVQFLRADTVLRMKNEIEDDIARHLVPKTVATFSELHDHVDANEYGGFCDDDISTALEFLFSEQNHADGMPQGMINFINECQAAVDAWLAKGRG